MKYCPRCGAQLSDDAAFCSNCGTPFEAQQTRYQYAPQYQQQADSKNGSAIASMVCGIVSLFMFRLILGIIAVVLANKSKQEVGYESAQAKAGRICGIVSLVLSGIGIVFVIIIGILLATGVINGWWKELLNSIKYYG